MFKPFNIKVPGSSANLGPGFDSIGLALGVYLTLEVDFSTKWKITSNSIELKDLPNDESHYIFQVAQRVAKSIGYNIPPCSVKMSSDIPIARGLGSSAAAIVAGIELANQLGNLGLSKNKKLLLANELEGHPDNVGASIYGGLVIANSMKNEVNLISIKDIPIDIITIVPKYKLSTEKSRKVLPEHLLFKEAVEASSVSNVLIAALLTCDWELAGKMMEKDLFHQPYRKELIPQYNLVVEQAKAKGAFGVALSGAGPTMLALTKPGNGEALRESLQRDFPEAEVKLIPMDTRGCYVY